MTTSHFIIQELGKHGEGVAFFNGKPLFIDGALPHEEVRAHITKVKSSYAEAKLQSIIKAHAERVDAPCSRCIKCGGCQIMHLSYAGQLALKRQLVKENLACIEGFDSSFIEACLASPKSFHYRNKMQLPVGKSGNKIVSGFYQRGSHAIVPYEKCLVHHDSVEHSAKEIQALLESSDIVPYCEHTQKGTLRHFILRANEKGEQLLGLVTNGSQHSAIKNFAKKIRVSLPNIVGILENINTKKHNAILGEQTRLLEGKSYLLESIGDIQFTISLASFFQINLSMAKILYQKALEYAELDENSRVLDAYCGIGSLSLLAAKKSLKVLGVECVSRAVEDAKANARLNKIDNADFIVAKLEERVELLQNIDVAFLNPPRQGLDRKVVDALNEYGPKRLVYISCNPHTLARDCALLAHYHIQKVQPVDMFPHTIHVETVVRLERRTTQS